MYAGFYENPSAIDVLAKYLLHACIHHPRFRGNSTLIAFYCYLHSVWCGFYSSCFIGCQEIFFIFML